MKFSTVGRKLYGTISPFGFSKVVREYHLKHPEDDFSWNINCDMTFDKDGYASMKNIDILARYYPESCAILVETIDELRESDKIDFIWKSTLTESVLKEIQIWR